MNEIEKSENESKNSATIASELDIEIKNRNNDKNIQNHSGYHSTNRYIRNNSFFAGLTLKDFLYAILLGVMGGIISTLVPFSDLMKIIYPFRGGTQLLSGHHTLWMAISYGITRKKKISPIITAFIKGVLEGLIGDRLGAFIIGLNLVEGISIAFGFWLIEKLHEDDTRFGWSIAGGIGNFTQSVFMFFLGGQLETIVLGLRIVSFIFAFLSGAAIAGVMGLEIVKLIQKALNTDIQKIQNSLSKKKSQNEQKHE